MFVRLKDHYDADKSGAQTCAHKKQKYWEAEAVTCLTRSERK